MKGREQMTQELGVQNPHSSFACRAVAAQRREVIRLPCRSCAAEAGHSPRRRAFTLLEVMIAVGVLFMCLFAILALLANSLASARRLQQHRTLDGGSIAGLMYVQLSNTNQVNEGEFDCDISDMYPDYKCEPYLTLVGTNGLCQIDFVVTKNQQLELKSHFLMYLPNLKQGGISSSLPHH